MNNFKYFMEELVIKITQVLLNTLIVFTLLVVILLIPIILFIFAFSSSLNLFNSFILFLIIESLYFGVLYGMYTVINILDEL